MVKKKVVPIDLPLDAQPITDPDPEPVPEPEPEPPIPLPVAVDPDPEPLPPLPPRDDHDRPRWVKEDMQWKEKHGEWLGRKLKG